MIFLGIGSSIGDAEMIFKSAEKFLEEKGVSVIKKSKIYKNPPMGGVAKNDFSNSVWQIDMSDRLWDKINWVLLPSKWKDYKRALRLLRLCKLAEKKSGRDFTTPKWSDRSLDLDILILHNLKIDHTRFYLGKNWRVTVPHPEIANRDFVLLPWKEIAGADFEIPGVGKLQKLVETLQNKR